MKKVKIHNTNLNVSKFVFGTASLFNAGSSQTRFELIEEAVDNGFTHFDTAPYYGFGQAERDLGAVLQQHPNITVTTKVGIYSPGGEEQTPFSTFLRKAGGKVLTSLSKPSIDFSVLRAKASIEGSLRRLKRDKIDVFMLHEPSIELLETEEWLQWLESLKEEGKVGNYGIAVDEKQALTFLKVKSPLLEVIQIKDGLIDKNADVLTEFNRPFQFTYGYVSEALSKDLGKPVPEVLKNALDRNTTGAVLVSTTNKSRIKQYADLVG
ncbi:aldo/keto reductase [Alteromonas oceani]|uniref:Aldo/keto reductase n=1 Tax=Alteromonas oceani TaxID=2071609 RepID=A0ABV7JVI4_9ALTE|nr:aldo/keto reductase [Alteromonas oceani]